MSGETFARKSYFKEMNLDSVRYRFRISSKMLDVKQNFPRKYRNVGLLCRFCEQTNKENVSNNFEDQTESQFHLMMNCVAMEDI